jgi:hypothetical protein
VVLVDLRLLRGRYLLFFGGGGSYQHLGIVAGICYLKDGMQ